MAVSNILLLLAAAVSVITALVHSLAGERRLIQPMLAARSGILENPLARQVVRLAWHWTSVLWLMVGAVLFAAAREDFDLPWVMVVLGAGHLLAGLADGYITRGRHIGWPLITAIGALTLTAVYLKL